MKSLLFTVTLFSFLTACKTQENSIRLTIDNFNGGFEEVKNAIPDSWILYTEDKVPDSNFKIYLDSNDYKEGKQSLAFDVIKCGNIGGWKSPGITTEIEVEKNKDFELSLWYKNLGSRFIIKAGGVGAKTGDMNTIFEMKDSINQWKEFKTNISINDFEKLRIEVNVLAPGKLMLDNVKIKTL